VDEADARASRSEHLPFAGAEPPHRGTVVVAERDAERRIARELAKKRIRRDVAGVKDEIDAVQRGDQRVRYRRGVIGYVRIGEDDEANRPTVWNRAAAFLVCPPGRRRSTC
jgi:hypothetical protein